MKERIGDTFMANIKAFRGYRYNTDKIDNLGSVISPPYYNMTKEDKDALYDKSEYNSVRLFSGKSLKVIQDKKIHLQERKTILINGLRTVFLSEMKNLSYICTNRR